MTAVRSFAERQEFFRSEPKPPCRFQDRPAAPRVVGSGWFVVARPSAHPAATRRQSRQVSPPPPCGSNWAWARATPVTGPFLVRAGAQSAAVSARLTRSARDCARAFLHAAQRARCGAWPAAIIPFAAHHPCRWGITIRGRCDQGSVFLSWTMSHVSPTAAHASPPCAAGCLSAQESLSARPSPGSCRVIPCGSLRQCTGRGV